MPGQALPFSLIAIAVTASLLQAAPQTEPEQPLALSRAVELALAKYPSIEVSLEQVRAAEAEVNLARTAYLPRTDFLGQVNRATHNNVFGLLLPQPLAVIPSMSGPVLRTNSLDTVFGTAAGMLISWEPFDFGARKATVQAAGAARDRAAAQVNVTRLQVAAATADAFLTLQAAIQMEKAADAAVVRAKEIDTIIGALVKNELRPGAESSRSRAELAAARTQWIQARQAVAVAKAALSQMTGVAAPAIAGDALLQMPGKPEEANMAANAAPASNPLLLAEKAAIAESKSRENILNHSYVPKFSLEGAGYGRGTGIQPDGSKGGFASGLAPNYQNWALGFNVSFAAFDFAQIRSRKDAEAHRQLAETAKYREIETELKAQIAKAKAMLDAAREIAENTPVQVESARASEAQARARYQAGLNNVTDLSDAQRLLTQSEIDDALAHLNIWRAMLQLATSEGDINPFLRLVEGK